MQNIYSWINSNDLKNWGNIKQRNCQENLPLLIKKLIYATTTNISKIHFPVGDEINTPGWDGILETSENNEFIPEGVSYWEIGCSKNVKSKADNDYNKRKSSFSNKNHLDMTYIFVSPRIWRNKDEWCEKKQKEKFWKDVRVYDAIDLETWIEKAPAVGLWLSRILEKYPEGVESLFDWWNNWISATDPNITKELVLAGRNEQLNEIKEKLNSSSEIIVQSSTTDESIAFLAASINSLDNKDSEFYLSRSIIVNNVETFKNIVTTKDNLLVIINFLEVEISSYIQQKNHQIYIPLSPDNTVSTPEIVLPQLGREEFVSALKKMGISIEDSEKYSRDTGRSITVLKRRMSEPSNQPEWAKKTFSRDIVPALLVGSWDESNKKDKEIISQLSSDSYDYFSNKLSEWKVQSDPPVRKIGDLWRLVAPMDAFFAVAQYITSSDLEKFKNIVFTVFKATARTVGSESAKRIKSLIYDKNVSYSHDLKKGVLKSLILLAIFGDDAKVGCTSSQFWVDNVISELLNDMNCDLWISIADYLPLIAEASPESFLNIVKPSSINYQSDIMCLFKETESFFGPSSLHHNLLWALENLAWSEEFLPRTTLILGKLAVYDPNPNSNHINRPKNTLREIFLPWNPQTHASRKNRLKCLDLLIKHHPEIGFNLLIDLMPKRSDISSPNSKPIWREFRDTSNSVTYNEVSIFIEELVNKILNLVNEDGERWIKILDNFQSLPYYNQRDKILKKLYLDSKHISNNQMELWDKIRKIISRHRSYPDAKWSLPEDELKKLEEVYLYLEPENVIDSYSWLFNNHRPYLLDGVRREILHDDEYFTKLRINALNEIKNKNGFEGIIELSDKIERPELIGDSLSNEKLDPADEKKLYSLLEYDDDKKSLMAKQYITSKSWNNKNFVADIVKKAEEENWSESKIVNCFISFQSKESNLKLLDKFSDSIKKSYWEKCFFRGTNEPKDITYFLKHVLEVKRYNTALDIASLYVEKTSPNLIAEILDKAAKNESEEEYPTISNYEFEQLFNKLYKSNFPEKQIYDLELMYLAIVTDVSYEGSPKALYEELVSNPSFFAELIRYIFRRKDGERDEGEEELEQEKLKQRAHNAYKLISAWNIIPGTENNGEINHAKLKIWVNEARKLCKELDRLDMCDYQIGELLSNSDEEDSNWPPKSICMIIDDIDSESLNEGFIIGTRNKRGVWSKSMGEGGKQEYSLAEKYRNYAKHINATFPVTASLLKDIAKIYEHDARKEDEKAEKEDSEY